MSVRGSGHPGDSKQSPSNALLSIGHSSHPIDHFLSLLRRHAIDVVVDARSQPYSRYAPQYNREALERTLRDAAFRYLFLGSELGGRPEGEEYYDSEGHVLYDRVAASALFLEGIERLERGAQQFRVALMCSEEDPITCHRRLLIGRVLGERSVDLGHIRGDGRIERESDLVGKTPNQVPLFGERKEAPWRSTRSVSRRGAPASSSRP
jgi:uncharacterized protein (DUF488 family)